MSRTNFLDEDVKEGDPTRKVANAQQTRRVRRILNDVQGMGCRVAKDTSKEGHGWMIIVDGESTDVPFPDGRNPFSTPPSSPTQYTTLGDDTEGSEAADTGTWTYGDTGTGGVKKGLYLWVQSRQAYFHAGDHKWYAYARKLIFSSSGQLYSVSAETRVEIEAPVGHSTL